MSITNATKTLYPHAMSDSKSAVPTELSRLGLWLKRLGARSTLSTEWGWAVARFFLIAVVALGNYLFLRETSAFNTLLGIFAFAVIYNTLIVLLLRQRKLN